jgi:hypothetical protein
VGCVFVCVVFAVSVLSACGGNGYEDEIRPSVSVDVVLAPAPMPGEQWPEDDWKVRITGVPPYTPGDPIMRSWTTRAKVAHLVHGVVGFDDVEEARRYFRRDDPRSYDEDFPMRVDESASYTSSSADDSHLYCLGQEGTSAACATWAYWGRYGQYVVHVDYHAGVIGTRDGTGVLHDGIALSEFLNYLRPFDEHVTRILTEGGE